MSFAEIFYAGGMATISIAFPSLLVAMWARDHMRPRAAATVAGPIELRKAA